MSLQEILNIIKQMAQKRKPAPVKTNGMKRKGVNIND